MATLRSFAQLSIIQILAVLSPLLGQDTAEEYLKSGAKLEAVSPDLAIFYLTRAIQLDPRLASAYLHRGLALRNASNHEAAAVDLKRASELDPTSARVLCELAEADRRAGKLDAALLGFSNAVEMNPRFSVAYINIAEIKEGKGDLKGAIAACSRAIDLDDPPFNRRILCDMRGRLRTRIDDLDGAIADFTKAIETPGHNNFYQGEPSFGRGSAHYMKHQWAEALRDFRQAAATCRDRMNWESRLHCWLARSRMGERVEADAELRDFVSNSSTAQYSGETERAFTDFVLGQLSENDLTAFYRQRSGDNPKYDDCRIAYYAGIKCLLKGDKEGAAAYFKKAASMELIKYPVEYDWARWEMKTSEK